MARKPRKWYIEIARLADDLPKGTRTHVRTFRMSEAEYFRLLETTRKRRQLAGSGTMASDWYGKLRRPWVCGHMIRPRYFIAKVHNPN